MRRFISTSMVGCVLVALAAGAASVRAAEPADDRPSDLLVRFNGPVQIAAADTLTSVWVFGNQARVDGMLRDHLVVVGGAARIDGVVEGAVVIINGHLDLGPTARIGDDVLLYGSTMNHASGAVVQGSVHRESGMSFNARAAWIVWFTLTLAVLVAALALVWLSSPAIEGATRALAGDKGLSVMTAALLVFVDVLKELPATLVLRPFNFNTLAVRTYELAADERLADAASSSLTIVLAGIIPVILLSRSLSRTRSRHE